MESLGLGSSMSLRETYAGRRVFVTGHTGFKGSWLCEWLLRLGAEVCGFSKSIPTSPSLFDDLGLTSRMRDHRGDVRDLAGLRKHVDEFQPEFVFHLAAQPLVRYSYSHPIETYETNVLGTIHLLEIMREFSGGCAVIVATSDKCYENRGGHEGYREVDPMGGYDPYSSSKGMAELAVSAYRRSYFSEGRIRLASVRAGNVIGGGDWADDRIIPDCIRSVMKRETVELRNPLATRPWQHVLEPLSGYLLLGSKLDRKRPYSEAESYCEAFNFGPDESSHRTVQDLVRELFRHLPGQWQTQATIPKLHEAPTLHLCIERAKQLLGWKPKYHFEEAVEQTAEWYRLWLEKKLGGTVRGAPSDWGVCEMTQSNIDRYERLLSQSDLRNQAQR